MKKIFIFLFIFIQCSKSKKENTSNVKIDSYNLCSEPDPAKKNQYTEDDLSIIDNIKISNESNIGKKFFVLEPSTDEDNFCPMTYYEIYCINQLGDLCGSGIISTNTSKDIIFPNESNLQVNFKCCFDLEFAKNKNSPNIISVDSKKYLCSSRWKWSEKNKKEIRQKNQSMNLTTDSDKLLLEKSCEIYNLKVHKNKEKIINLTRLICEAAKKNEFEFINNHQYGNEILNLDCDTYAHIIYEQYDPKEAYDALKILEGNEKEIKKSIEQELCNNTDNERSNTENAFNLTSNILEETNNQDKCETGEAMIDQCSDSKLNCNEIFSDMSAVRDEDWSTDSRRLMFYGTLVFVAGTIGLIVSKIIKTRANRLRSKKSKISKKYKSTLVKDTILANIKKKKKISYNSIINEIETKLNSHITPEEEKIELKHDLERIQSKKTYLKELKKLKNNQTLDSSKITASDTESKITSLDDRIKTATKKQSYKSKIKKTLKPRKSTIARYAPMLIGASMIITGVLLLAQESNLPSEIGPYSLDELEKEFFSAIDQRNTLLRQKTEICL